MNCQAFEGLITDLVRNRLAGEIVRTSALEHAARCSRCAGRLANERALSEMFRFAADEKANAPNHIETALLAAYRMRSPRPVARPLRLYWGIAAALVLSLTGVTAFKLINLSRPNQGRIGISAGRTPPSSTTLQRPVQGMKPEPSAAKAKSDVDKGRRRAVRPRNARVVEVATDFIPLTGNAVSSFESGQLIRVLLPRSALATYGLPVNQELADRPVTAQVLLGEDGVARAIRFLSDANIGFLQTGMQVKQ